MPRQSLYDRLGGREGIRMVVDAFYDHLLDDPTLAPFFADADMEYLRQTQTTFLCDAAGGPEHYDAAPPRDAHLDIPFTPAHIQRTLEILEETLDDYDIPPNDADEVIQAIAAYEDDLLARPADTEN